MKTLRNLSSVLLACGVVWLASSAAPTFRERPAGRVLANQPAADSAAQQSSESEPPKTEEPADTSPKPADSTPQDVSPGLKTLREARTRLAEYRSIQAELTETVAIGYRRFKARGSYVQGGNLKLRMEFHVSLGEGDYFDGNLLQVCDGQVLWTVTQIGPKAAQETSRADDDRDARLAAPDLDFTVTRRDVRQILNVASGLDIEEKLLRAEIGLGGLPALLAALERGMTFGDVEESTIDGKPFIVVQGRWSNQQLAHWNAGRMPQLEESATVPGSNPETRASGDADSKKGDAPAAQREKSSKNAEQLPRNFPILPPHVPDRVRIYLDRENLFPRRILYLKRPPGELDLATARPMLALDFVKVVLNAPVDESLFEYSPPDGVVPNDVTQFYIRQLQVPTAP